ncbi:unnamed protein product [Schistosoma mattheei]|uniref:Uncharacterized protein n=2 Tax=Schistosoma TaxID=6181 RepID=A0A183KB93_9TREM|nr:unnamed protein product [Schistosoma curassoni]VDP84648.1 unnamed protein product [Schistosoma mattheei]
MISLDPFDRHSLDVLGPNSSCTMHSSFSVCSRIRCCRADVRDML